MSIGFIILRHVRCEQTNKYWIECYNCIRKFYKETIIIIDDNSCYEYITNIDLVNTIVIDSEYKGAGELLPYVYYLENELFDTAVILHDSVFIQRYINFPNQTLFLWHFEHNNWDNPVLEEKLINASMFDNMLDFYRNKSAWKGCFGAMTVMPYKTLKTLDEKYHMKNLTNLIKNRVLRQCFERILAGLITSENFVKPENCSLFGDIHHFKPDFDYTYEKYIKDKSTITLPIIKIWTGR